MSSETFPFNHRLVTWYDRYLMAEFLCSNRCKCCTIWNKCRNQGLIKRHIVVTYVSYVMNKWCASQNNPCGSTVTSDCHNPTVTIRPRCWSYLGGCWTIRHFCLVYKRMQRPIEYSIEYSAATRPGQSASSRTHHLPSIESPVLALQPLHPSIPMRLQAKHQHPFIGDAEFDDRPEFRRNNGLDFDAAFDPSQRKTSLGRGARLY